LCAAEVDALWKLEGLMDNPAEGSLRICL